MSSMDRVRLDRFRDGDLTTVTRLYNELIAGMPCNWPVSTAEFTDEVMGRGRLADADLPFDPATLLIASVAGTGAGFVHFHRIEECGLIRFLTFPEGRAGIGTALLNAAVDRLCRTGCTRIEAWQMGNGYPFYTSMHGGCWEQGHVTNLFLANGFETFHREVMFQRSLAFGCERTASPDGRRIEKSAERFGHDVLHRYAIADGEVEAARTSWHRMSALSRHPSARDHAYIHEVATAASHRRRGLGMALMREMLFDMRRACLREATLHTMFDNTPAIGLYTRAAFRYIGTNIILRKSIAHSPDPHHGGRR